MVGMLNGKLYVVGKEANVIKARTPEEKDSVWYRLTLSNQARTFEVTCGEKWKIEVAPGKVVEMDVNTIKLMSEYECSFDIEKDSKGYTKVKLRTFKPASSVTK